MFSIASFITKWYLHEHKSIPLQTMIKRTSIIWILCCGFSCLVGQTYNPGQSYLSASGYTEYLAGELPFILAAPHGGELSPASIPDRDCEGCTYVNDANTQDLARRIYTAVYNRTGCYPHVVLNRLHRRKLDANRDLAEAADGNAQAAQAWDDFHAFIEGAKQMAATDYDRALFIDLHGHAHSIQRLELGYLLYGSELRQPDDTLNSARFMGYSSIRQLAQDNLGGQSHAALIRGAGSLGQLLANRGYPAVPSADQPAPAADEDYFSGGYNTDRHGSRYAPAVDAIQIECNMNGVRDTPANRQAFADSLAAALEVYFSTHYFDDFGSGFCTSTAADEPASSPQDGIFGVFPNPVYSDLLNFRYTGPPLQQGWLGVYQLDGRLLGQHPYPAPSAIPAPTTTGSYIVALWDGHRLMAKTMLVAVR